VVCGREKIGRRRRERGGEREKPGKKTNRQRVKKG